MFDLSFLDRKKTREKVSKIREDIIRAGKSDKTFQAHGDGPKYKDPDDLENTGSINDVDANILHNLVHELQPGFVFEIGSWFGTSSAVMSCAGNPYILTCDKHDFFQMDYVMESDVEFYHGTSESAMLYAKGEEIHFDFAFIDGSLNRSDAVRLLKLMRKKVFAFHDFTGNEKGVRAYKELKKLFNGVLVKPAKGSSIALYFDPNDWRAEDFI